MDNNNGNFLSVRFPLNPIIKKTKMCIKIFMASHQLHTKRFRIFKCTDSGKGGGREPQKFTPVYIFCTNSVFKCPIGFGQAPELFSKQSTPLHFHSPRNILNTSKMARKNNSMISAARFLSGYGKTRPTVRNVEQ